MRALRPTLGAGFVVCLAGDIMTMPGLPKRPAALDMDVSEDGEIDLPVCEAGPPPETGGP